MSRKHIFYRWLFVFVLFAGGIISCLGLSINDNALDLLPEHSLLGDVQKLQRMGLVDRLFITLTLDDGASGKAPPQSDLLFASAGRLGKQLAASDLISFVFFHLPSGYESGLIGSLGRSLPLLQSEADFARFQSQLRPAAIQEGLERALFLLNTPAGIGLKQQIRRDPLGLLFAGLEKASFLRSNFSIQVKNGYFVSPDGRSCLVFAEASRPLTDSNQAALVEKLLDTVAGQALAEGVRMTVVGSLPHTLANARTIQNDLKVLLPAASLALFLLLALCLRTVKSIWVFAVPFMAAPTAIGLASLIHGELSRLALGFGVVLLGIAVDFSLHLFVAQNAFPAGSKERKEGLHRIRRPILFASTTSASVFIVLLFSDVASHRQMATLALCGLILAVVFAWLLIPTLGASRRSFAVSRSFSSVPERVRVLVFPLWILLLVCGAYFWTQLHYDGDLQTLNMADASVTAAEQRFRQIWGERGEQAFVLVSARDMESLLQRNEAVFQALTGGGIQKIQSFAPFLPSWKLQQERLRRWQEYWATERQSFERDFQRIAGGLGFRPGAFRPFFNWLDAPPQPVSYADSLNGPFGPLIQSMLSVKPSNPESFLALTTVVLEDDDLPQVVRLSEGLPGVTVVANARWKRVVEEKLRHDVVFLSIAALITVTLIVFWQFRNLLAVFAVLAPVSSALSAMAVFSGLSGGELNMMHLIMGVMVIGLSVDYGIFMACNRLDPGQESSAFAVSVCAASSLIGFGVLAFALHPALRSLGSTVLVGIGAAWPTALFVTPLLLDLLSRRRAC